jgi:hypothetical protein
LLRVDRAVVIEPFVELSSTQLDLMHAKEEVEWAQLRVRSPS